MRPVRGPWRYPSGYDADCRGQLPDLAFNNEPIGPESSVRQDDNPGRIAACIRPDVSGQSRGIRAPCRARHSRRRSGGCKRFPAPAREFRLSCRRSRGIADSSHRCKAISAARSRQLDASRARRQRGAHLWSRAHIHSDVGLRLRGARSRIAEASESARASKLVDCRQRRRNRKNHQTAEATSGKIVCPRSAATKRSC